MQTPALKQVRATLARRHRYAAADERAVVLMDSVENNRAISGITSGLSLVLSFIGVLTLAIGGVGIMNIMFVSVNERTREIGIRKALGARRREILAQFLLEGLVITFIGGLAGILVSCGLVWLISPRPFLAELMDDLSRSSDIHLVLTVQTRDRLHGGPVAGRVGIRPVAGRAGFPPGSDRSAALRIAAPRQALAPVPWREARGTSTSYSSFPAGASPLASLTRAACTLRWNTNSASALSFVKL